MARAPSDPRQASLFDPAAGCGAATPAVAPRTAAHLDAELRAALSEAIKASGKSREEIAAEMEERLGSDPDYPVSKAMLDAMTAPSRSSWRFPVIYLDAFVEATGAEWLADLPARRRGRVVLTPRQAENVELADKIAQRERLNRDIKRLMGARRR